MTYQNEIKEWLSEFKMTHFKGLGNGIKNNILIFCP
jgi:hypothetical protein